MQSSRHYGSLPDIGSLAVSGKQKVETGEERTLCEMSVKPIRTGMHSIILPLSINRAIPSADFAAQSTEFLNFPALEVGTA